MNPLPDLAESLAAADFRQSLARMDAPLMVVLGEQSAHYKGVPPKPGTARWCRIAP